MLKAVSLVQNAFETSALQNSSCPIGSVCCADAKGVAVVRTLRRNATSYTVSAKQIEKLSTQVSVLVNQSALNLSALRSFSASLIDSPLSPSNLVCADGGACFFALSSVFSSGRNSIGISNAAYAAIPNLCAAPVGAHVLVSSFEASVWDQFASFRSLQRPYGSSRSDCVTRSLNSSLAVFECSRVHTTFSARIPSRWSLSLRPMFSTASVRAASLVPRSGKRQGEAVLEVLIAASQGLTEQEFQVRVDDCSSLGSSVLVSEQQSLMLHPGSDAWLSFLVSSDTRALERGGSCRVLVASFGHWTSHVVELCAKSARARNLSRMCTVDQVPGTCAPVDCLSKYLGNRSFYNVSSGLCDPTPVCAALYNPTTNKCVESGSVTQVSIQSRPNVTKVNTTTPFVCVHGVQNVSATGVVTCTCDFGWATDFWTQQYSKFVYCNVTAASIGAGTAGTPATGGGGVSLIGSLVIGAFVVGGLILVVLVLCCICKARKRQLSRRRQNRHIVRVTSDLEGLRDDRAANPPISSCAPLERENTFNFRLPATYRTAEGDNEQRHHHRVADRNLLLQMAREEASVFFRVDETSFVPGHLVVQTPFVEFRVEESHALFTSFPRTPLTQREAQKYIFVL